VNTPETGPYDIKGAGALATRLAGAFAEDDDLSSFWQRGEEAIAGLAAAGYSPEEFIPEDEAGQLGFATSSKDFARRFYQSYASQVRKALCGQDELRTHVDSALTAGATSLLTWLAGLLAVPLGAVMLLAPIAAVLLIKGIDAFCQMGN
jgi:hypothetical protein